MDLESQLLKIQKLGATPSKSKSKAEDEAKDRTRVWQITEMDLDESKDMVDQLMKDLDMHTEKTWLLTQLWSLGLARDIANSLGKDKDLKPSLALLSSLRPHMKLIWWITRNRSQS